MAGNLNPFGRWPVPPETWDFRNTLPKPFSPANTNTLNMHLVQSTCVCNCITSCPTWVFLVGDGLALCGDRVLEDVHSILYSLPVKTNLQRVDAGWHILGQQITRLRPHPLNKGCYLLLTQTFRNKKWETGSVMGKRKKIGRDGEGGQLKLAHYRKANMARHSDRLSASKSGISYRSNSHDSTVRFKHAHFPLKSYLLSTHALRCQKDASNTRSIVIN